MKFADSDDTKEKSGSRPVGDLVPSGCEGREPAANLSPDRPVELDTESVPALIGPDGEASPAALFDLYEKIAETTPGARDAEIFEKIREWTFSDFSLSAHEFIGIPQAELQAWQKRHRINLSAGRIRPNPVDIQRGHAWGHIRMAAHANHLRSSLGPPSADELSLSIMKMYELT
jgi:hypothetical protein